MRIIGLLGGVASGKSLVARQLADLGAGVLDADRAGHEALRLPHVAAAVRARWGDEVFGSDGQIDRRRLAKIVFAPPPAGPQQRTYLEQLTHPEIARLLQQQAEQMTAAGTSVAVLDAPLLAEAAWDAMCERLLFVDAPRDARLARALARGWSERDFVDREAAQLPLEQKRRRADFVVDNSGTAEKTREQVTRFWQSLSKSA